MQNYYNQKINTLNDSKKVLLKKISHLSIMRLTVVLAGIYLIYLGFSISNTIGFAVAISLIVFFAFLVKKHNKLIKLNEKNNRLIRIYKNELNVLSSTNIFGDGEKYKNPKHEYSSDLDIFGKYSLFNILNRTVTVQGEKILSDWLLRTSHPKQDILDRQEIVKELATKNKFRDKFLLTFYISDKDKEDDDSIDRWVRVFKYYFKDKKVLKVVLYILSALTTISLIVGFINPVWWRLSIPLLTINYFITMKFKKRVDLIHEHISKQEKLFLKYSALIKLIKKSKFKSKHLQNIKMDLTGEDKIDKELRKLSGLIKSLDYRLNLVVASILNLFLFWDIHYSYKIEDWMLKNSSKIKLWLDKIGDIDAHLSLSILYFNNPDWVFPLISDKELLIKGKNIGHPLINKENRIDNDYSIEGKGKFDIVTGSNMAGKSTFLRTIGLNTVLALNGCPVCAESFEVSSVQLITYMRIIDSLEDNLSTFHAELERIKSILKYVEKNDNCFLLLDELLRGTNSQDRHVGTKALIKQMMKNKASGIIATHDLALTEMVYVHPNSIRNYNFGVKTKENELYFDYKLTDGVCDSFNASILMKKIGIDIDFNETKQIGE